MSHSGCGMLPTSVVGNNLRSAMFTPLRGARPRPGRWPARQTHRARRHGWRRRVDRAAARRSPPARVHRRIAAAGRTASRPPSCTPSTGTIKPEMRDLRIGDHGSMPLIGANGTSLAFRRSDQFGERAAAETPIEFRAQRFVVLDARQALVETRVAIEFLGVERLDQPQPEFLERREVNRDQPRVRRAQDVSLRQARAIGGFGRRRRARRRPRTAPPRNAPSPRASRLRPACRGRCRPRSSSAPSTPNAA